MLNNSKCTAHLLLVSSHWSIRMRKHNLPKPNISIYKILHVVYVLFPSNPCTIIWFSKSDSNSVNCTWSKSSSNFTETCHCDEELGVLHPSRYSRLLALNMSCSVCLCVFCCNNVHLLFRIQHVYYMLIWQIICYLRQKVIIKYFLLIHEVQAAHHLWQSNIPRPYCWNLGSKMFCQYHFYLFGDVLRVGMRVVFP